MWHRSFQHQEHENNKTVRNQPIKRTKGVGIKTPVEIKVRPGVETFRKQAKSKFRLDFSLDLSEIWQAKSEAKSWFANFADPTVLM